MERANIVAICTKLDIVTYRWTDKLTRIRYSFKSQKEVSNMIRARLFLYILCALVALGAGLSYLRTDRPAGMPAGRETIIHETYGISDFTRTEAPFIIPLTSAKNGTNRVVVNTSWSGTGDSLAIAWRDDSNKYGVSWMCTSKATTLRSELDQPVHVQAGKEKSVCWMEGQRRLVYISDVDLPDEERIREYPGLVIPSLSTSSQTLAVALMYKCAAVSNSKKHNVQIANVDLPDLTTSSVVNLPVSLLSVMKWSPRGDRLCFVRKAPLDDPDFPEAHLYVYDPSRKRAEPIVTDLYVCYNSWSWAVNGDSIYFCERNDRTNDALRLWHLDLRSKVRKPLVDFRRLGETVLVARVSPDGEACLIVTQVNGKPGKLSLIDFERKAITALADGDIWAPEWSPNSRSFVVQVNGNAWIFSRSTLLPTLVNLS